MKKRRKNERKREGERMKEGKGKGSERRGRVDTGKYCPKPFTYIDPAIV